jgi:L-ribulokinase
VFSAKDLISRKGFDMKKYAIGLDFGTNSCRALLVDLQNGKEVATSVFMYPSGKSGILIDPGDPNVARQNPRDYLAGIEDSIKKVIRSARARNAKFNPEHIIGIGIDTTGSSPMPVDEQGVPLAMLPKYRKNLNAMVWLWKDHTSYAEAAMITDLAGSMRPHYLSKVGGTYSSEWFWSKILHCKNIDPEIFNAAFSFVEICDYLPAVLTGNTDPLKIGRTKQCIAKPGEDYRINNFFLHSILNWFIFAIVYTIKPFLRINGPGIYPPTGQRNWVYIQG